VTYRYGIDAHGAAGSFVQMTLYATRTRAPTWIGQPLRSISWLKSSRCPRQQHESIEWHHSFYLLGRNTN
jgi:hypothetical protein